MKNFIYLVYDASSKDAVLIDPAWEPSLLNQELVSLNVTLKAILLTHGHFDHVEHIPELLETHTVPIYMSEKEAPTLTPPFITHKTMHQDTITAGTLSFHVIHTPGHTPGGQCFLIDNHLFTGDTLFIDGCGRCNGQTGNIDDLYTSLEHLKTYPNDTLIYPGHHYATRCIDTLGNQKQTNRFLNIKTKNEFIRKRTFTALPPVNI